MDAGDETRLAPRQPSVPGTQPVPGPQDAPWDRGAPPAPYEAVPGTYGIDHPNGTIVLVLGILSLCVMPLCGPFAWVMGSRALREIDARPWAYKNRGTVMAGYVTGIIGTCMTILLVILLVIMLVVMLGFVTTMSRNYG